MKAFFYNALTAGTKACGPWFFTFVAGGVAAGYFLFSRRRRAVGVRFYAALFPHRSRFYHHYCTWKQFRNFTDVFMDRFIQSEIGDLSYTIDGKDAVTALLARKAGGILLMSHMGNWEVAAHLLRKAMPGLRLMLYMGIRHKEEIEKIQKQSVRERGVKVLGVDEGGGSPFDIVEAIGFLRSGGFVSMAGDRIWRDDQRTVSGVFLGNRVRLPEAPFVLALVSGAPLIAFFAFRTGNGQYEVTAMPPFSVTAVTRDQRLGAIGQAAQCYLDHMAAALAQYPFQWYHFDGFLEV
jgi:predicted LPLAT superfamily acyltransferase